MSALAAARRRGGLPAARRGVNAGDQGQKDAERENSALADRIASIYKSTTGSAALIDLAAAYRVWGGDERALRRTAKGSKRTLLRADGETIR